MTRIIPNPEEKLRLGKHRVRSTILHQARTEGNILFGGRAIRARVGLPARPTKDFDFFSKDPKQSANVAQKNLDKRFRSNVFFEKPGTHKGTYKVKHVGRDGIPRTDDDVGIADFTKTPRPIPKFTKIGGVNVRTLKEELKAKERLILDPNFRFRRAKDKADLELIKRFRGRRK